MFNNGEGGFEIGTSMFLATMSATARPSPLATRMVKQNLGLDVRTLKDATGKPFGAELYAAAQKPEGEITEVGYMFPRPGADKTPVPKVSLFTRVGDLGCGVEMVQVEHKAFGDDGLSSEAIPLTQVTLDGVSGGGVLEGGTV